MILPMLSVKDVVESIEFYKKLGFQQQMALPGPDGITAFAFVNLGPNQDTMLGLTRTSDVPATPYIEFMVSLPEGTELDGHYKQVKANGIAIAEEIKTQYWGDRSFTVVDPDGYRIVLFQTVHQPDIETVAAIMRGEQFTE